MTQQVKLRVRVYSDRVIDNPERYYDSVFSNHYQYWSQIDSEDDRCIVAETKASYDLNEDDLTPLKNLYSLITPHMLESTSRSYVKV